MATWLVGIRPRGKGLEISIWRGRKRIHQEIVECDPYKAADVAAAVKHRDFLKARAKLGLPLHEGDTSATRDTFSAVSEWWLASLQIDADTIRKYWNMLNRYWVPAFGDWPVDEITHAKILETLAGFGLSIKTQKNITGPLRMVLGHARVTPNPVQDLKWPKREKPEIERYRPKERNKLLGKLKGQANVYFAPLFATGLRPGKALALRWEGLRR